MRIPLAGLVSALVVASAFVFSAPAEAGWKWKKMKWVPKHGQEYRSPYAHPGHGYGRGYNDGYRGYGYRDGYRGYHGRGDDGYVSRSAPYGRGYGYSQPYGYRNHGWD